MGCKEILKLRAKRKDGQGWAYLQCVCKNGYFTLEPELDCKIIPKTIGLYSGDKDKNGREIYQGDIIRRHTSHFFDKGTKDEYESKSTDTLEVVYNNNSFGFIYRSYNVGTCEPGVLYGKESDDLHGVIEQSVKYNQPYAIIGNVIDNPELRRDKPEKTINVICI